MECGQIDQTPSFKSEVDFPPFFSIWEAVVSEIGSSFYDGVKKGWLAVKDMIDERCLSL